MSDLLRKNRRVVRGVSAVLLTGLVVYFAVSPVPERRPLERAAASVSTSVRKGQTTTIPLSGRKEETGSGLPPAFGTNTLSTYQADSGAMLNRVRTEEEEWLAACQLPDGALTMAPGSDRIVPYFANLAALTLLEIDPSAVRRYILWYLDNLNEPDRWGLSGTVYDHVLKGERTVPAGTYDSADSYASTFLSLVSAYVRKTGDTGLLLTEGDRIRKVAGVLLSLQDRDGLVRVKPGSSTKYLMDNCENYAGLTAFAEVLELAGLSSEATLYKESAERIKKGVFSVLFDPVTGKYAWAVSQLGKKYPRDGKWYPDAVSQLFLISCGLILPDSEQARAIWQEFNARFPAWEQGVKKDSFPWGTVALVARAMSDYARAERYLRWAVQTYVSAGRPYPWYILESACLVELYRSVPLSASDIVLAGTP